MTTWERVFAAGYDRLNARMEAGFLGRRRAGLVAAIEGSVLELGAGTGANLRHYGAAATVVATEPSAPMLERLRGAATSAPIAVEVVDAPGESLPFDDESFDAVVATLVLCSVDDVAATLAEARRVLRPGGRLHFLEHGGGAPGRRGVWQRRIEPVWSRVACGCRLTRDPCHELTAAGFTLATVETFEPPQTPGILLPFVQGVAVR